MTPLIFPWISRGQSHLVLLLVAAFSVLSARNATAFTPTMKDAMVQVTATASDGPPPQVTLTWTTTGTPLASGTAYTINRRRYGQTTYSHLIDISGTTTNNYTDTTITPGYVYEYQIFRYGDIGNWIGAGAPNQNASTTVILGYVASGDQVPLRENRGTIDVLVDSTIAAACTERLNRLTQDLIGDGWRVIQHTVTRDTNTLVTGGTTTTSGTPVAGVRSLIVADLSSYPDLSAVLLFGHVPIPFSGFAFPDGHYTRAMPCDGYYGDLDTVITNGTTTSVWTDGTSYPTSSSTSTNIYLVGNGKYTSPNTGKVGPTNLPGDGRWDLQTLNSRQLMVGRIDFSDLSDFTLSETQLLNRYLDKDHNFRSGLLAPNAKGVIAYTVPATAFRNTMRTMDAWFGPSNVSVNLISGTTTWNGLMATSGTNGPFLSAQAIGSGSPTGIANILGTTDMAANDYPVIFTWLGCSFAMEWWNANDMIRAMIAMPTYSLTCAFSHYSSDVEFERFSMGFPVGAMMQTSGTGQYPGDYFFWNDNSGGNTDIVTWNNQHGFVEYGTDLAQENTWTALMGDPSLPMYVVPPPSRLAASLSGGNAVLSWDPSPDTGMLLGYNIYRGTDLSGTSAFTRLNSSVVSGTTYTDKTARSGNVIYMVRAVNYENRGTGLYTNASQGQFVSLTLSGSGSLPPTALSLSATTTQFIPLAVTLSGSDPNGNSLLYSVVINPVNGSLSGTAPNLTYTPTENFTGTDSFTYVVNNGLEDSALATVNLTINPGITITSPVYGNRFVAPASIPIAASTDPARTFTNVTFYSGTMQIGVATSPPYTYDWTGVGVGPYSLTATGTDSLGNVSTSAVVAIAVDSGTGSPGVAYTGTSAYTQTFDSLGTTNATSYPWTDNSTLPGWYALTNGTSPSTYQGSDGSVYNGSILYSLGVKNNTNRALGCTAYSYAIYWGVCLINETGAPIISFTLSFTGEEWRDQGTKNITFAYSPAAVSLSNGAFTSVPALTFVPPHATNSGTYDGSQAANQVTYTQTVTIPGVWDVNGKLWLRWTTGPQDAGELGIDNMSLSTPSGGPPATPTGLNVVSGTGVGQIAVRWSTSANATDYLLERSAVSGSTGYSLITTTGTTSYLDNDPTLTANTFYYYEVAAANTSGTSAFSSPMSAVPGVPATFGGWDYSYFGLNPARGVGGPLDNPEKDGVTNLMKYALGLDPLVEYNQIVAGLPTTQPVVSGSSKFLALTFDGLAMDVTYIVEGANSPAGPWTALYTHSSSLGIAPGTKTVTDTVPILYPANRLLRLRVIQP